MGQLFDRLRKLKESQKLSFGQKAKEFGIGVLRSGEQIPRMLGNIGSLGFKGLSKGAGAIGELVGVPKEKNIFVDDTLSKGVKQLGEDITRAGEEKGITQQQRGIRRTAGEIALTAPAPIKSAGLIKGGGLLKTAGRGALVGAEGVGGQVIAGEGRLPTTGELVGGAVGGAVAGPVLEKAVAPIISTTINKLGKFGKAGLKGGLKGLGKSIKRDIKGTVPQQLGKIQKQEEKGREFLFQAVNPTKIENKTILKKRVDDLLPYIDTKKPLSNTLEKVKTKIDTDRSTALSNMQNYETKIGVKGTLNTDDVVRQLKTKYQEKIGDSFINPDEAKISQNLIDTLEGFGKKVKDNDIIKIRRAWDKIEKKNKGFMMSAEATSKGDIFGEANKFFRQEIRKSNPEYAKFLEKYHKTTTIGDVIQATIDRRVGQQKGGFIKRGFETGTRITGAGTGGIPGYLAAESLIQGAKLLSSSSVKLTRGAGLLNKAAKLRSKIGKNGVGNTRSRNIVDSMKRRMTPVKKPLLLGPGKPQAIVTPQTIDRAKIIESKKELGKAKIKLNKNNSKTELYNASKEMINDINDIKGLEELKSDINNLGLARKDDLIAEINEKILGINEIEMFDDISTNIKKEYGEDLLSKFKKLFGDEKRIILTKSGDKYTKIETLTTKNAEDFSNTAQEYLSENPWGQNRSVQDIYDELKDKIIKNKPPIKEILEKPKIGTIKGLEKKIEQPKPLKSVDNDLINEAKKYKSADDIKTLYSKDFIGAEMDELSSNLMTKQNIERAKGLFSKEGPYKGKIPPVEVSISREGEFAITDGHHRSMAGFILNKEIPVKIVDNRLSPDILGKYIALIKTGRKRSQIYKSWNEGTFAEQVEKSFNQANTKAK